MTYRDPASIMQQMTALHASYKDARRAQYGGMQRSRFRKQRPGVSGVGSDGDYHAWPEERFIEMREYAEAMYRDDAVIKALANRSKTNVIRDGFGYEPMTTDDALDDELEAEHKEWATDPEACDIAGQFTFADFEGIGFLRELISGDCFIVGTNEGKLQAFEAQRCCTPHNRTKRNIVHGIELSPLRRRVRYYFKKEIPGERLKYNAFNHFHQVAAYEWDEVVQRFFPAVWHLYDPWRWTMTRGVTALHPCFDKAGIYEDAEFANLIKIQAAACWVGSWESDKDAPPGTPPSTGMETLVDLGGGQTMLEMGVSPGQILTPPQGKKLVTHSPGIPSEETMAYLKATLQIISVCFGVPLNVGLLDPNDSGSYSAFRGALDQAKLGWMVNQSRIENRFHRNVPTWRIRWHMSQDTEFGRGLRSQFKKLGMKLFRHRWQRPSWPYTSPKEDANAAIAKGENFLDDWVTIDAENGRDAYEVADRNLDYNAYIIKGAIERAKKIKEQTEIEVHYTEVMHRAVPKGSQIIDQREDENAVGGRKPANARQPEPEP